MTSEGSRSVSKKQGSELDKIMYGYTSELNVLEEENKLLRETVGNLKRELDKFQTPPHLVCEVKDVVDGKAILSLKNGNEFFVDISSAVTDLRPGDLVIAQQKNLVVLDKINTSKMFNVEQFVIIDKPSTSWNEVGGLKKEINEVQEVIELPMKQPELFKEIGISPPKGILLYGPPGTGKTLMAKAVAASTNSTFIEVVGSELVQKFIGEGAKLIKELFDLARAKAPAIVFIDELDAVAAQRVDIGTSGEREVQRTFMQLLAEIDGFDHLGEVKIIGATNRKDILDPAIVRPGRLDRLIYIPNPDPDGIKEIFKIHTKRMKLDKVDRKKVLLKMNGMSGAEIRAVCTEAGYFAIREGKGTVNTDDFLDAVEKVKAEELVDDAYLSMFS
jgi:proteasome regulatory subunit